MSATISIPFAVGEEVWAVGHEHREEWISCPECAGTKALRLVKGNGEEIELACNYCGPGYDPPSGRVTHLVYDCQPERFVCRRVLRIEGDVVEYSESATRLRRSNELFRDREECAKVCAQKNVEYQQDRERREIANLESKRRSLAHSSHYWTSQRSKLLRDLGHIEARIRIIKERKQ